MFKAYVSGANGAVVPITKDEVAAKLRDGTTPLWIDISGDFEKYQDFLKDVMRIHPLSIEDVLHTRMLPKIEEYDDYLFIILHDIILLDKVAGSGPGIKTHEIYIFLGKNYVITLHKERIRSIDSHLDSPQCLPHLFSQGAEVVMFSIIRKMIDNYFPMLERIETRLDNSEDAIFESATSKDLQGILSIRKSIAKLRSIATQQLDIINRIAIGEFKIVSPHGLLLARDIYDHLYRVSEMVSFFRETTMGLLDAYLSEINNNMNQVMKVLTVIATLLLPLGVIVGFYGMNFKRLPGLDHPYGWLYMLIGLFTIMSTMLAWFRHKKWI